MLSSGQQLGAYLLEARIGAGGMGEVWKAEDTRLGRAVAIKILPAAVAADAEAIARMKREARTAAQLYHPNIATIHSIEQDGDTLFIVMELAAGVPLKRMIAGTPLPEADVCRIGRAVADALAEAHEKGIVHRDIKPENIVVNGTRVKVLDFGIAKRVGVEPTAPNDPTAFMTQQGMIVGTVYYMSPEQALGKGIDPRSDLFSLGVVLYEAATGRMPFAGETITETITQIIRDEPEEPRRVNPMISAGLNAIIAKCLRKDREERFATAAELSAALDRQLAMATTAKSAAALAPTERFPAPAAPTLIQPPPPTRRRVWPWVLAVVAVTAVVAGVLIAKRPAPAPAVVVAEKPKPPAAVAPPPTTTTITVIEETPKPQPAPAPVPAPAPQPPPPPARTADDAYNEGMARLVERRQGEARDAFRDALAIDPHHAKANFRLGEINLVAGSREAARRHFDDALADSSRLDAREQKLVRLGLAILDGDRIRAHAIARELREANPRDPDLMAMQRELGPFPGQGQGPGGRGRRPWRP